MTKRMTPPQTAKVPDFAAVLGCLLVAINAAEGCSESDLEHNVVMELRETLYTLKNRIGSCRGYLTNEQLAVFDKVFTKCGWDDQGLRWACEDDSSEEDIFIVQFTDKAHEEWELT